MNRIKQTLFLFALIATGALFQACVDDKSTESSIEIANVTIADIPAISASQGDEITIEPSLTFENGTDDGRFTYEWFLVNLNPNAGKPTETNPIGTERNLNITIEGERFKDYNNGFTIIYKITDTKSNVAFRKSISLNIAMILGYVAICEKEDGFDLDMVALDNNTTSNKLTLHNNLLDKFESTVPRKNCKPLDVSVFTDQLSPMFPNPDAAFVGGKIAFYVLSDKNTSRINTKTFAYAPNQDVKNITMSRPEYIPSGGMIADKISNVGNNRAYIHAGNNWFFSDANGQGYILFNEPINRIAGTLKTFNPAPYIGITGAATASAAMLYDTDNCQFVYHDKFTDISNSSVYAASKLLEDKVGDPFPWKEDKRELFYMSQRYKYDFLTSFEYQVYAVVKNASNQYSLYLFQDKSGLIKLFKGDFPASSGIETATHFAWHPTLNYFYFASDTKISCIQTTTMTMQPLDNSQLISAGHKISLLKYTNNKTISTRKATQRLSLAIATYNPSGVVGSNGTLQFFDTEENTGILQLGKYPAIPAEGEAQINMSWSGLGKVVGLDFKNK